MRDLPQTARNRNGDQAMPISIFGAADAAAYRRALRESGVVPSQDA